MSSRYYKLDSEEGEQPGKISSQLREALNLADNELPLYIYRMRALGYPPGWLKKAVVSSEDIFDTDSKKRKEPSQDEIKYDHSKFVEYPGFNVPSPPGTIDNHYYYNMPPMLDHQQLDYAKKHMKHMNAFGPPMSEGSRASPPASPPPVDTPTRPETKRARFSGPEEVKLISKGSPMPKPVDRLPLERFSEGVVGDLLYFENIPNSKGKFDSLRGLLNTKREK